jgi:hypothetical protein
MSWRISRYTLRGQRRSISGVPDLRGRGSLAYHTQLRSFAWHGKTNQVSNGGE